MANLFNETLSANDVKPRTLLHQLHRDRVLEILLGDVLADGPCHAPYVLEPVTDVLVGRLEPAKAGQTALNLVEVETAL